MKERRHRRRPIPDCRFSRGDSRAEGGNLKAEYTYDGLGRRRIRRTYSWNAQTENWSLQAETRFVWDGWNLLAELSPQVSSLSPQRVYTCGLDLSGQLGGEGQDAMATAGGIGGILAVTSTSSVGGALRAATSVFLYDGNGNVANLADAGGTAATLATYEYGPFGNTLVASGPLADTNPIRCSTKYFEGAQPHGSSTQPSALSPQPSLYYYGYRYYAPGLGRWVNRDPIGERGGTNLMGAYGNIPTQDHDPLGLKCCCCCITGVVPSPPTPFQVQDPNNKNKTIRIGHRFTVDVTWRFAEDPDQKPDGWRACRYTWRERSNRWPVFYNGHCTVGQWCDITELYREGRLDPGVEFPDELVRMASPAGCSGEGRATDHDAPEMTTQPGAQLTETEFEIVVQSGSRCRTECGGGPTTWRITGRQTLRAAQGYVVDQDFPPFTVVQE